MRNWWYSSLMGMLLQWDGDGVAMEIRSDIQIVDNQEVICLRVVIFADRKSSRELIIRHLHNTHPKVNPPTFNAPPISDHLFFFKIFIQKFCILTKHSYLCNPKIKKGSQIEIWCNGSTTDSGSVSEGSSPSISTTF